MKSIHLKLTKENSKHIHFSFLLSKPGLLVASTWSIWMSPKIQPVKTSPRRDAKAANGQLPAELHLLNWAVQIDPLNSLTLSGLNGNTTAEPTKHLKT